MIRFNEIFSVKVNFWGYEGLSKVSTKTFNESNALQGNKCNTIQFNRMHGNTMKLYEEGCFLSAINKNSLGLQSSFIFCTVQNVAGLLDTFFKM